MKRKMAFIGMSYAIGLFCASLFSSFVLAVTVFCGALFSAMLWQKKKFADLMCCIVCFLLGFSYYVVYDLSQISPLYSYDGESAKLCGNIVEISENGDKVTLTVEGTIDDCKAKVLVYTDNTAADIGDSVEAYGKLSSLKSTYIFDSKSYYKSKGIVLAMYNPKYIYAFDGGFSFISYVTDYAQSVKQSFKRMLPNEEGELLCAMLFGDKSGIDQSGKTEFYRSGIGHIMATSGLHLVVIVSMLAAIPFLRKNPFAKAIAMILSGGIFVVCAGFSSSVIRAYIMLTLCYCAPLFFRKSDTLNSLAISILIMTLPSPYIIASPSFVLSVFGVLSTAVFAPFLCENIKSNLVKTIIYPMCISICIIPAGVLYFDEISLISPISNILLIPLCTFALCTSAIAFVFADVTLVVKPLLALAGFACRLVNFGVKALSSFKFAAISGASTIMHIYILIATFAVTVAFLMFADDKKRLTKVFAAMLGMLVFSGVDSYLVEKSNFVAVYSGSDGTVCIVKNENGVSVIDAGCGKACDFAIKYLSSHGISKIDSVYLLCDVYSSQSKWEYCAEDYKIGNFYNCTLGLEDENVKITEYGDYCVYAHSFSLAVVDDVQSPLSNCDNVFLLGKEQYENYICQSYVKGFSIRERFGQIRSDCLEYAQEE